MAYALRAYQLSAVDSIFEYFARSTGNPIVCAPTGCHAAGQMLLDERGRPIAVEDVRVGGQLLGVGGEPRTVLSLCRGVDEMYEITPLRGGRPFTVNGDHVLSLVSTPDGKAGRYADGGDVVNLTVRQYLTKSKYWRHMHKLYRSNGVVFDCRREPEIDPYFLGVLIGDGSMVHGWTNVTTADPEIELCVRNEAARWGLRLRVVTRENSKASQFYIVDRPKHVHQLSRAIKLLNLNVVSGEKFIPAHYKRGSRSTRLAMLAGLVDTDGHVHNGGIDYVSKSMVLAEDVAYVARSLGLCANVVSCRKGCQTGAVGTYWRVSISGDCSIIPTRIERKKIGPRKMKKRATVTGFSVTPVGPAEFYGFMLDGDHLYHLDDFTVTHNSGKSLILAEFCKQAIEKFPETRIVVATHVQELIQQDVQKLVAHWPRAHVGIYSAALHRKQTQPQIVIGGIQSMYRKARDFGHRDILIVDEAQMCPHSDDGMYRTFIEKLKEKNPYLKVIGLTATPYRLGGGMLTVGPNKLFDSICHDVDMVELIDGGFLSPLVTESSDTQYDTSKVASRGGDFVLSDLSKSIEEADATTVAAVNEVVAQGRSRRAWLVFCTSVKHAALVLSLLRERGVTAGMITGESSQSDRSRIVGQFQRGEIKCIVNVMVLLVGFDAPHVDLIAMMRPTQSPGLMVQCYGRGMRIFPGKRDCKILDYGGNIERHGPINAIRPPKPPKGTGEAPTKVCPKCKAENYAGCLVCPECGHEYPPHEVEIETAASRSAVIARSARDVIPVAGVKYRRHVKEGKPDSVRVDYYGGLQMVASEWVCLDHGGRTAAKAKDWVRRRMPAGEDVEPGTTDELLIVAGRLAVPKGVEVMAGDKKRSWREVIGYVFDEVTMADALAKPVVAVPDVAEETPVDTDDLVGEIWGDVN